MQALIKEERSACFGLFGKEECLFLINESFKKRRDSHSQLGLVIDFIQSLKYVLNIYCV